MAEVLSRCIEMLSRVARDLVQFQDGRGIPLATLESFSVVLELAYRELLVMDFTQQLNNEQKEASDIVCRCLSLVRSLQESHEIIQFRGQSSVLSVYTGRVGRPRCDIPEQSLEMLLENRFTVPLISNMLCVSVSTIRRRMSELGLSVRAYYSDIPDSDLDEIVERLQQQYPLCGNRQMYGHLLSMGHRIQQARIRESQRRVDPCGTALRRLRVLNRRQYSVPGPLSLYHIDGHHKLIRFVALLVMMLHT
jgi:hypothetical protein